MIDYLLRFSSKKAAKAALHDALVDEDWPAECLPVALVTADPVFGAPDGEGMPVLVSDRETLSGFWLLTTNAGQVGQVAAIERETGRIVDGDPGLAGARLDPVWAGGEPTLRGE